MPTCTSRGYDSLYFSFTFSILTLVTTPVLYSIPYDDFFVLSSSLDSLVSAHI